MRAGTLDRKIAIQRKSVSLSSSGDVVETWGDLVSRLSASVTPTAGDERFSDPQLSAKQTTTFRVRWHQAIADLNPKDRIEYNGATYDVLAVHEQGRRETLEIIAFRRPDR